MIICNFPRFFFIFRNNNHLLGSLPFEGIYRGRIIHRNTVSPPQLPADTPVLQVFHPVAIGVFVFFRVKFDRVIFHVIQRRFCQFAHLEKPLHRQFGFDGHIGTFRVAHFIGVCFDFFHQPGLFQVFFYLFAHIKAVHSGIHGAVFVECAIGIENIDGRQVVFFSQHVVVYIVRWCHFQATRTEFHIHIFVLNDGY